MSHVEVVEEEEEGVYIRPFKANADGVLVKLGKMGDRS